MSAGVCVIWIDWYSYHVARFRALSEHRSLRGRVHGLELVGGSGVHGGLVFRSDQREGLPVETLLPKDGWAQAAQKKLAKMVWNKLDQLDPAAVLVPGYYTMPALAAALWAKKRKRRSILMTESTREDHRRQWWKETAKSQLIRGLFDAAIAGGHRHVAYLRDLGFAAGSIGRNYDVVDNDYYRSAAESLRQTESKQSLGLPDDYFLYVGRLAEEKNLGMLIQSFEEIKKRGWKGELVLAGDGPLRESLQAQVRQASLENSVHFVGLKATPELIPLYAFARAFVLPSKREPWGLVVNEAMAAGLPVAVSSRCGCADDLVEAPSNGYVFDPEAQSQLTAALWSLAGADEAELRRMSRRSTEIIGKYSLQNWAEEVARLA